MRCFKNIPPHLTIFPSLQGEHHHTHPTQHIYISTSCFKISLSMTDFFLLWQMLLFLQRFHLKQKSMRHIFYHNFTILQLHTHKTNLTLNCWNESFQVSTQFDYIFINAGFPEFHLYVTSHFVFLQGINRCVIFNWISITLDMMVVKFLRGLEKSPVWACWAQQCLIFEFSVAMCFKGDLWGL